MPVRCRLNPRLVFLLNLVAHVSVKNPSNHIRDFSRIAGLCEEKTGRSFQFPDGMNPRRHDGHARRNRLEGDEGQRGPYETVRKDRDVAILVNGTELLPREQSADDEQCVRTRAGLGHGQPVSLRIAEKQYDLRRVVPRKEAHEVHRIANSPGFLRRPYEDHPLGDRRESFRKPRTQARSGPRQEKRVERVPHHGAGMWRKSGGHGALSVAFPEEHKLVHIGWGGRPCPEST